MDSLTTNTPLLGGRYQLQQTLGVGGMAVVYRAWDERLERPVAIKILRQDFSQDQDFRERFRMEAKSAANLSHPNIVTVHDFGFDQGRLYIVMEYIPGTDLKTLIKNRGRFSIEEAINLMVQACAGIGYAHRAGIIHCDIKPHNMLVTPDQRLKVTDFGIARALASIQPNEQHDVIWGSPLYFAPEQASGAAPSPSSDVYSLGVVLYEMLTGQLPFYSNDPDELARLHRDVPPIPPRQINSEIPPALDQIILKVLSKEPAARYRTSDQFGRILLSFSQNNDPYGVNIPSSITPQNNGAPLAQHSPSNNNPDAATRPPLSHLYPAPTQPQVSIPSYASPAAAFQPVAEPATGIDWATIGLGLLATLLVGGLIPLWLYIYLYFKPGF